MSSSLKGFMCHVRLVCVVTLLWPLGSQALDIPDFPLFLTSTGVAPNFVLTLDDSLSMRSAYVPDSIVMDDGRYDKAANYNRIYYDPTKIYLAPKNADGTSRSSSSDMSTVDTAFTSVYRNGFDPAFGTVNLATGYLPTETLNLDAGSSSETYMNHYKTDVTVTVNYVPTSNSANEKTSSSATYTMLNFVDVDGTANGSDPGNNLLSVKVDGSIINKSSSSTYSGSCATASPGNGYYKTKITGSTLELCFRSTLKGKIIQIVYKGSGTSTTTVTGSTPGSAYYYVFGNSNTNCTGTDTQKKTNNNCYSIKMVSSTSGPGGTDERQNFANWYAFYRTRNLTTISATSITFAALDPTVRVAWQALETCTLPTANCDGWKDDANVANTIGPFTGVHKNDFYAWLFRLPTHYYTPLPTAMRRVGAYLSTSSPYDNFTSPATTPHSCRKNYHLMMTDGVWTKALDQSVGNTDSAITSWPTAFNPPGPDSYIPQAPFQDQDGSTYDDNVADVAFKYWITDLSGLDNTVSASYVDLSGDAISRNMNPKNDPATWQHMVNFIVGFGLSDILNTAPYKWDGDAHSSNASTSSYPALVTGTQNWPHPTATPLSLTRWENVVDLWHAAINSRGDLYSADDVADLITAFETITNTVSSQAASGGGAGLSANTTKIAFDSEGHSLTTAYEAKFNADWSGTLEALPILANGTLGVAYWEAGVLIPSANLRNIWTWNSDSGTPELFKNCTGLLATALNQDMMGNVDSLCTQRLAWLRGYTKITSASWAANIATFTAPEHGLAIGNLVTVSDVTPKDYNGSSYTVISVPTPDSFTVNLNTDPGAYTTGGKVRYANFRDRTLSVLGDIMNSDPVYAHEEDFGYGSAAVTGKDSYAAYVTTKAARTPMVYVGANDGMLHGFKAITSGANAGVELFAFVPAAVYDHLSALTAPGYLQTHKYFVDGPPTLGDAYDDITHSWKTYLVGGLGAGGKSVYALDVSTPDSFAAGNVKWEFMDATDLGLTFGQPQIAPISASEWAVIFGNGYNSASDKAFLYIVNLQTGELITKIPTNNQTANGLSTPYLYDSNGDRIVDAIYAGDLQGNLWKFDKSSSSWGVGNGGAPLFIARNNDDDVQSITSQPKAIAAQTPYTGGVMIYFGTGRYLESSDLKNDQVQTFYAVWDNPDDSGTVPRDDLLKQEILSEDDKTFGNVTIKYRTVSVNTPKDTNKGCYLDFPATAGSPSERIISTPLIKLFKTLDKRVIVTTATPSDDPCEKGGISWLMELNLNCGRLSASPFDFNGDDQYDEHDEVVADASASGLQLSESLGITKTPLWLTTEPTKGSPTGTAHKAFTGSTGNHQTIKQSDDPGEGDDESGGGGTPKRISWEQIL